MKLTKLLVRTARRGNTVTKTIPPAGITVPPASTVPSTLSLTNNTPVPLALSMTKNKQSTTGAAPIARKENIVRTLGSTSLLAHATQAITVQKAVPIASKKSALQDTTAKQDPLLRPTALMAITAPAMLWQLQKAPV